jgi:small subunit ribosomal protein S16
MVKIRLRRIGAKKQPSYRVVVADSRSPRDGRFIEVVGFYNPRTDPETVTIKEDRALYWLNVGAQPTEAVARLLRNRGTMDRFERLKQGESMEALVAEAAEAAEVAAEVSPKTRLEGVEAEDALGDQPEPEASAVEDEVEPEETAGAVEPEETAGAVGPEETAGAVGPEETVETAEAEEGEELEVEDIEQES